jgi:DNA-binding SARP family transcriptional activator
LLGKNKNPVPRYAHGRPQVGVEFDWSTVINFEILGGVTARQDGWEADLKPQPQLMLSRLVVARGRLVSGPDLKHALGWDEKEHPPERGLKQVVSELRSQLSPALSREDLRPGGTESYQLSLQPEQADVLRFWAGLASAKGTNGPDRTQRLRQALGEWPDAAGLFGGYPLSGLPGAWADDTRFGLQSEYRNAVMECITQNMNDGRYEMVMQECDELATDSLATDSKVLGDDEFVEKWTLATCWSGHRTRAGQILRRAADFTKGSLGQEPSAQLLRLAELIRNADPRLDRPNGFPDWAAIAVPEASDIPAPAPIPTYNLLRPVSNERAAMSESSDVSISITGNAQVGSAIGRNEGDVTIHMRPATEPSTDPGADEPDNTDCGEAQ